MNFWAKRVLSKFGENKIYQMGMIGALIFAAQMFNFPVENETSGHLIGNEILSTFLSGIIGILIIFGIFSAFRLTARK